MIVSRELLGSSCKLHYHNTEARTLTFEPDKVEISFPWEMMKQGETILYMAYPLIELKRQELNSATIHAGCVSIDGHGILFLGDGGSGKTTLSLRLARELDAKIHSTDLTVIRFHSGKLYCLGGTRYIDLRLDAVKKSFPEFDWKTRSK